MLGPARSRTRTREAQAAPSEGELPFQLRWLKTSCWDVRSRRSRSVSKAPRPGDDLVQRPSSTSKRDLIASGRARTVASAYRRGAELAGARRDGARGSRGSPSCWRADRIAAVTSSSSATLAGNTKAGRAARQPAFQGTIRETDHEAQTGPGLVDGADLVVTAPGRAVPADDVFGQVRRDAGGLLRPGTQSPPDGFSDRRIRGNERWSPAAVLVKSTITSPRRAPAERRQRRRNPSASSCEATRAPSWIPSFGGRRPGVAGHASSYHSAAGRRFPFTARARRLLTALPARPLVSPFFPGVLFTVAAAIRFAVAALAARRDADR